MSRYFIEVAYRGTNFSGFQIQENAVSVQAEVEKALKIFFKAEFELTCSSRTDAGVHALKNYFHFDSSVIPGIDRLQQSLYNLNAIVDSQIVIKNIILVSDTAHCRFDAVSREYEYYIYNTKNPFLSDRAFYYPFTLDIEKLQSAADTIKSYTDFTTFSKRNTQVKTFECSILSSKWAEKNGCLIFNVKANRFLRGMVKGLVGTMLRVGTGKISVQNFVDAIESKDCSNADFSVPAHGLFLMNVEFMEGILPTL
jgi:tRNA pseudouridine38-40 synthase